MRLLKMPKRLFSESRSIRGFSHLETVQAEDLNLSITRYLHQRSGAMVYNIKANDQDNTFAPIVKTLPENSTGCPHILEHLACCGSHKFPVRDPFFNMLRRSVNTYMNAWTGEDFTAYPFSSPNAKDFQNLYNVYLDMCLKPLLNQLDFRQEGWRYELNPETKQKQIKGIVFNQMKGAYQNSDRQLYVQMSSRLYASTPYSFDSGGKPDQIVKLSYEEVQQMHRYYYHPSNMSFFYYGNSDIRHKLEFLENQYLLKFNYTNITQEYKSRSQKLIENMPSGMQKIFHSVNSYTAETPNVGVTYNLGLLENVNSIDLTCLNILSYLLLESNQALFYQEFIEANLADSFGSSGLNLNSVVSFMLTLKNIKISSQEALNKIEKCLKDMVQNGINEHRLEEYIRKTELDILTPKQTQGIVYLSNSLPYMTNRLPLNNLINIRSNLNAAVSKLKKREGLQQIISKYFLANNRKIVVRQEPIPQKSEQPYKNIVGLQMAEQTIISQQQQLKTRQESKQNLRECLPKLSINDLIPGTQKQYQVKRQGKTKQNNQLSEIHVGIDVKGINFVRVVFKLDMSSQQNRNLLPFLDIWRYAIKQGIAVKGLTNKQLSSKLNLCSNDFDVSIEKGPTKSQPTSVNIVFSASCLKTHIHQYLSILKRIISEPEFKQEDIGNIFRSYKSEKTEELLDGSVMQYCLDYGSSLLTEQAEIFNSYNWVAEGLKIADSGQVPSQFATIHQNLMGSSDVTIIQHTNDYYQLAAQQLGFLYEKPQKSTNKANPTRRNEFIRNNSSQQSITVTNTYDVNFCTQQYVAPQYFSKQHAEIVLLIELMEQDYLHQKIREKGGAYGARATYRDVGTIALYSYMDPYSTQTYGAFEESIEETLNASISKERLEQLKIKVIGGLEVPIVPQRQCINRILKKFTIEQRSRFLRFIREAEWQQIISTGKKYLQGTQKSRVMFGKDVPPGFAEEKLKIPKSQKLQQEATQ